MASGVTPSNGIQLKAEWVDETRRRIALALITVDYFNGWQMGFLQDIDRRLERWGTKTALSEKQMVKLSEILGNIGR